MMNWEMKIFDVEMMTDSNSIELSPSWETNSCSATQIPIILWNPKVHCHIHKSPILVPIHSQRDAVRIFPSYLFKVYLILSSYHLLSFFPVFTPKRCISFCHMHATCPAYLVLLNLMTLIGWDGMDWLDLAQNSDQRRTLVKTVMNLRVP
jgi:hypothetical protein